MSIRADSLVALDLGETVGVVLARRGHPPILELLALTGNNRGARFLDLHTRLPLLIEEHGATLGLKRFELGCYEAALPHGNQSRGMSVVQSMFGYAGTAEMTFSKLGMRYMSEHLGTMRSHVSGRGGGFGEEGAKAFMIRHCNDVMGLPVTDGNVADAVIVAEYFANCAGWSIIDHG